MPKAIKGIAIGAAVIGLAVATGGISLAPSLTIGGTTATVAGATLTVGAVTVAGAGLATTALGSLALTIGASMAISGVASQIAGTPKTPATQIDRLNLVTDPNAYRKSVLGSTAFPLDVRYQEYFGADQEYVGLIVAHAAHKIQGIREVWLNDELAWTADSGVQGRFVGYFWVQAVITEGSPSNTVIVSSPNSGKWNGSHRLTGCAYSQLQFRLTGVTKKAESPFSGGVPSRITVIGDGAMVYDPRRDSTVPGGSGPMRADDQSTWRFFADDDSSEIGSNLPLQILQRLLGWRITNPLTGEQRLSVGVGWKKRRLHLESFLTAANLADEQVTKAGGGTEPRYWGAITCSEGNVPNDVLTPLLTACNGRLVEIGGKIGLVLAHNDLASASADVGLLDDDVVGDFIWNPDPAFDQCPNVVSGSYTDPSSNSLYQQIPYPEARLASADGVDVVLPVDLTAIESPTHAQRVSSQILQRRQYDRTFSAPFDITAWRYAPGRVFPLTYAPLGFDRKLVRIVEQEIGQGGQCNMTLRVEDPAIYAWDGGSGALVQSAAPNVYDTTNSGIIAGIGEASETAAWSKVLEDDPVNHPKPADGATVGAPENTYVAGKLAQDIADAVDDFESFAGTGGVFDTTIADIRAKARQGSPNLLKNGDFKSGLENWTGNTGSVTPRYSASIGSYLSHSPGQGGAFPIFIYQDVPVDATAAYSFSFEGSHYSGGTAFVYAVWRNAANSADLATMSSGVDAAGGWSQRYEVPASTAPTGSGFLRIIYFVGDASAGFDASRFMVQRGAATDWRDDASLATYGSKITTLEGDSAAYSESITDLVAQVAGTEDSGLKTSIATAHDEAVAAADAAAAVATRTTVVEGRVGGRLNLVQNGSGEQGMAGIGGATTNWGTSPPTDIWGTAFRCYSHPDATNAITWPRFNVQAGETYTVSADPLLFASSGQVYVDIIFYRADGSVTKDGGEHPTGPRDFSADGSGKTAIQAQDTAPSDAVQGEARFVWSGISGLTVMGVRQMQVERGPLPWTAYNQNLQPLYAQASITQGALAELTQQVAYIDLKADVDGGGARIGLLAKRTDGSTYSYIVLDADDVFINASRLMARTIVAEKFVTDEGVDLAALVPGFNYELAGNDGTNARALTNGQLLGPIAGSGFADMSAHRIDITVTGAAAGGTGGAEPDPFNVYVDLYCNRGSGWSYVGNLGIAQSTGFYTSFSFSKRFNKVTLGANTQLGIYLNCFGSSGYIRDVAWNADITFRK